MRMRVFLVKVMAYALLMAAIMVAIFVVLGSIGAMEFGAEILPNFIKAAVGLVGVALLGKAAYALLEV